LRKVSEYEQHADECRRMAAKMKDETHKRQLEEMAEAWTMLATERHKQLSRQRPRQAGLDSDAPLAPAPGGPTS
jgi:hypothetical protein